ncbi:MAG: hypothetical protein K2I27_10160, partial [Bacteroides sp.]|nr:hypothetical protein [Bacteroides sp.]
QSFILIECNYIFIFVANMERYGKNNRISPVGDRTEVGFRSILAEASDVSRGVCEAICRTLSPRFSKEEKQTELCCKILIIKNNLITFL